MAGLEPGGVFSFPCFLNGLPGDMADLCRMLSSVLPVPKYESSAVKALLFPGERGAPRALFVGLPNALVVSFIALSKAIGRSWAPGGCDFLLGLPCGVETGVMKLVRFGVPGTSWLKDSIWLVRVCRGGRRVGELLSFLLPCEEGNRLVMKLDILYGGRYGWYAFAFLVVYERLPCPMDRPAAEKRRIVCSDVEAKGRGKE